MSVLYKLNEVQEARQNKYSQALKKAPLEKEPSPRVEVIQAADPEIQLQTLKTHSRMFKGIIALLVLLILAVSMVIVLLLRNSSSEKKALPPKTAQIVKPEASTKVKAKTTTTTTSNSSRRKTSKQ